MRWIGLKILVLGDGYLAKHIKKLNPDEVVVRKSVESSLDRKWDGIIYTTFITDVDSLENMSSERAQKAFNICLDRLTKHLHNSKRFVYVSSVFAKFAEQVGRIPTNYGRLKLAAEQIALTRNNSIVIRTDDIWGWDRPLKYEKSSSLISCAPTHVEDLAKLLLSLANPEKGRQEFLQKKVIDVTGQPMSKLEFVRMFNPEAVDVKDDYENLGLVAPRPKVTKPFVNRFACEQTNLFILSRTGVRIRNAEEVV